MRIRNNRSCHVSSGTQCVTHTNKLQRDTRACSFFLSIRILRRVTLSKKQNICQAHILLKIWVTRVSWPRTCRHTEYFLNISIPRKTFPYCRIGQNYGNWIFSYNISKIFPYINTSLNDLFPVIYTRHVCNSLHVNGSLNRRFSTWQFVTTEWLSTSRTQTSTKLANFKYS